MRSRDVWAEVAPKAGIAVEHRGLVVAARRPEASAVLAAFLQTEMGEGCRMMSPAQAITVAPQLKSSALDAVLVSPHEIRVESSRPRWG
jgi:glycine/D-amino acid oxidase-like deaminating enzyme